MRHVIANTLGAGLLGLVPGIGVPCGVAAGEVRNPKGVAVIIGNVEYEHRKERAQRERLAKRDGERTGVGGGLLEPELQGGARGWERLEEGRLPEASAARRLLVRPAKVPSRCQPDQKSHRGPDQPYRIPHRPDA